MPALLLLAPGQLISWGSLYYGITFLEASVHQEMGWSEGAIFSAYSAGLLVTAIASPFAGALLARYGARWVMSTGSLLAAVSCFVLAASHSMMLFILGWILAGIAMALVLYEAAFAALREFNQDDFRRSITTLTLIGGFASTIFWPLTHASVRTLGWRGTVALFAILHLCLAMPLHISLPRSRSALPSVRQTPQLGGYEVFSSATFWTLSAAFFAGTFFAGAISAHAGRFLTGRGVSESTMLLAVSLVGPMQVTGRVLDLSFGKRSSLARTGSIAYLMLPFAVGLLLLPQTGGKSAIAFTCVYGMANGVLTIVSGLAPAEMLSGIPYASAMGWLSAPAMLARSVAPAVTSGALALFGVTETLAGLAMIGVAGMAFFVIACRLYKQVPVAR